MVNSLSSFSRAADATDGESDADAALAPVLEDEERVQYVLVSSKGIEQTTDGRTTTVEPDADHDAYAVVTDFRILFFVGSDAAEPSLDIEFDLASISMVEARSSLLSSSLVVVSGGSTTVKFTPSSGPDLEDVADYIDRIGSAWADLYRAIDATREAIDAFEERLTAGEDAHEELTTARSRLSNAYHHATHNEDGSVEVMRSMVEPVEAELDRLQVEARLDRVDELLATAEERAEFDAAVTSLVEARDRLDEARDALDPDLLDGDAATDTIEDRAAALDEFAASLLADAEDACHRAADADDPDAAATAWEAALERYRTLLAADWDGLGGVDADALRSQLAWVVGRRIDALLALAADLEAEGDDLDDEGADGATDSYELAKAHVESARTLAADHPHADADRFDDRIADLEEKIEVSEWQWGNA